MTQEEIDIMYMRRCLQLAANGLGRVRPNPMVGCVVCRGVPPCTPEVISEGYHQEHGHNHAERNALLRNDGAYTGVNPYEGATLYVNLEPCSHYGHTPPCADLIIEKGIRRVVCCNDDPNPLVSGNGFRKLEAAGIEVTRHVLESEGRELNRRFFTFMEKQRPYVILKWAESADGFMAPVGAYPRVRPQEDTRAYTDVRPQEDTRAYTGVRPLEDTRAYTDVRPLEDTRAYTGVHPQEDTRAYTGVRPLEDTRAYTGVRPYWLSTQRQNRLNHRWRTEEAAILVGSETYLTDSPTLTARHYLGPQPQPIVLDRRGRLSNVPSHWLHLRTQTVADTLKVLYEAKLQSVIVEGGRQVLDAFIQSGLYDEVRILRSPQTLGSGLPAPEIPPIAPNRLTIVEP